MDRWSIPAGQLEASFARAAVLQREIERKERLLGRRIQGDLFTLVSATTQAGEQAAGDNELSERLLSLALDGLRTGPAPDGAT